MNAQQALEEFTQFTSYVNQFMRKFDYKIDTIQFDDGNPNDRLWNNELFVIFDNLMEITETVEYLNKPVLMEDKLELGPTCSVGNHKLSPGDIIEVLKDGEWIKTMVIADGTLYPSLGRAGREGLKARIRFDRA